MLKSLKDYLLKSESPRQGLLPIEWLTVAYVAFTSIVMLIFGSRMTDIAGMVVLRAGALAVIGAGYLLYKKFPVRLTAMLRVGLLVALLAFWYPDLYGICKIFPNADYPFAVLEQNIFGCQPALLFSEVCTSKFLSECFYMGYFFYFPMIALVLIYYFFARPADFERCATIILGAFFTYYLVFMFLPVAGPQYYFNAIGLDAAYAGDFHPVGDWFGSNMDMLEPPGWKDGFFYKTLAVVRESGERPVASFPSSHVGVSTILMFMAVKARSKGLLTILTPLWIFLCCATIYIRAHYVVDVIAGFITAPLVYLLLYKLFK